MARSEEELGLSVGDLLVRGILIGWLVSSLIFFFIFHDGINITQEVADDICHKLTGNNVSVAKEDFTDYKLICEIPSYDTTTNIIVRKAGDAK